MDLWWLRRFGRVRALRGSARRIVGWYYRPGRVRSVLSGPLAGKNWVCSREQILWMPLGQYESQTAAWIAANLRHGMTFFDIGAHVGYFTLLGSHLVGDAGLVVAFEPNRKTADVLAQQLDVNRVRNVTLKTQAVAAKSGRAEFCLESEAANSHLGRLDLSHAKSRPRGTVGVETISLDEFVAESGIHPGVLKIDVEGAELEVLEGAKRTLGETCPYCLVSTHSEELEAACRELLQSRGYQVTRLPGFEHELIGVPPRWLNQPS